jgi:filamentous hemagglutinin family protein
MRGALIASLGDCVLAQNITLDGSLGRAGILTGPNYVIPEAVGQTLGNNLFHSFWQFNLNTGEKARFQSDANITNIFSRVTGGSPSFIDGLISTQSRSVNLFLINPSGIVFGPNASLDVGSATRGSFVATTVDALVWSNGGQFSATNPGDSRSLLTLVGDPSGFLSLQRPPQSIVVRALSPDFSVYQGQSLLLLGGDVSLDGGNLLASGGRIELGGVAGAGTVGLNVDGNNLGLSFPDDVTRADVSVTNGAVIGVLAEDGGSIAINARNLNISGGSILAAGIGENLGSISSQAGDITLNATGTIKIANSLIFNDVEAGGGGNGGNININARSLSITDGALLSASTFGQGNAGSININGRDTVSFDGVDSAGFSSAAFSIVGDTAVGNGGNININAGSLSITDGAQVSASTSGRGNSGNVYINVRDTATIVGGVVFRQPDGSDLFIPSAISNNVEAGGVGNGGDININARSLSITDGALLSASTFGQGNSGSIILQADESVSLARNTAVFNQVQAGGVGNGGDINITAGSLSLTDGAQIQAFVGYDMYDIDGILPSGRGDAGDVNINVRDSVTLFGKGRDSATGITAIWNGVGFRGAEGDGGDININARSLSLTNAVISSDTNGNGDAGDIFIRVVDSIYLTNSDSVLEASRRSRIGSAVTFAGVVGNGGNIDIQSRSLSLDNGAVLDARTQGNGNAGNIRVSANTLTATNGGQISTSNSGSFRAGTINLNVTDSVILSGSDPIFAQRRDDQSLLPIYIADSPASGVFTRTEGAGAAGDLSIKTGQLIVRDGAQVTVSSTGSGIAGSLIVKTDSIRLDNKATISADTFGGGGNINLSTGDLILRRGSSVSTNARGSNIPGGNITIYTDNLITVPKEDSDISANAQESFGGRVIINAQGIFGTQFRLQDTPLSDITASSELGPQFNGVVQLNTPGIDPSRGLANLPTEVVDASNQIAQTCGAGGREARKNEFIVTGRRGMPSNPYEPLSSDEALEDIHPPSDFSSSRNSKPVAARSFTSQSATSNPKPSIVEAQGWVINDKGQVVLTATASTATPHNSLPASATCPSS